MPTGVEAGLICYTTGIIAEDFCCCCFMNVQMAYESAIVFVCPFHLKCYIVYWTWTLVLQPGKLSGHEAAMHVYIKDGLHE